MEAVVVVAVTVFAVASPTVRDAPAGATSPTTTGATGATTTVPAADPRAWTVYHGDPAGSGVATGVSSVETGAPAWTSPTLAGELYGEPLVADGLVYVATEDDTVYALSTASGAVRWSAHLGQPVPASALPCGDISPTVGITGTPVLDVARGELFVVADEMIDGSPAHRLVGIDSATGAVELDQDVDPPGSRPQALLQRTGLTLDGGRVVFGYGGNDGDCSTYRGWVVSVGEAGGSALDFAVDAAPGESQGAVWMGGAAPAVDAAGSIWVSAGNGSVYSDSHPYDDSDSVLELSPSLALEQYFAPSDWASNNARDLDLSMAPALLADGQVVASGKTRMAYLLSGTDLGGIGGQKASLAAVCGDDVDGGSAVTGTTVFLPCVSGPVAIRVGQTPPSLQVSWTSDLGGGPPVVAAGLVWTIGQDGTLYGLDPATGAVRQQTSIGAPANHFPTPGVGDGLLLAPSADRVVAFTATERSTVPGGSAGGTTTAPTPSSTTTGATAAGAPATLSATPSGGFDPSPWEVGASVAGAVVVLAGAWWWWRRRHPRRSGRADATDPDG